MLTRARARWLQDGGGRKTSPVSLWGPCYPRAFGRSSALVLQEWMRGRRIVLAPVASITNSIYRRLCKEQGADYCVTELVSSEALTRESLRSYELARFTEAERPIAVQIFGGDPEK